MSSGNPPSHNKYASQPTRYWCEFCRIFVYNNKISRQNHEADERHKNNKKRFIGQQYKKHADQERQKAQAQAQMAQIERAAMSKYTADVANGLTAPTAGFVAPRVSVPKSTSVSSTFSKPATSTPSVYQSNQLKPSQPAVIPGIDPLKSYLEGTAVMSDNPLGNWERVKKTPAANESESIDYVDVETDQRTTESAVRPGKEEEFKFAEKVHTADGAVDVDALFDDEGASKTKTSGSSTGLFKKRKNTDRDTTKGTRQTRAKLE